MGTGGNAESRRAAELTFQVIQEGDTFAIKRCFPAEDVDAFARVSGDFSPLHVDEGYAGETEFGGRVVHGMLLASLFSQLVGMHIPGKHALYVGQELSFRRPVMVGECVTATARVTGKNRATRTIILAMEIRNAEDKVCVGGVGKVKVRDADPLSQEIPPPKARSDSQLSTHGTRPVALVTGASGGLGSAIARELAGKGYAVVIGYGQRRDRADALCRSIVSAGGEATVLGADLREASQARSLVEATLDHFGSLNLLVNSAVGELHQGMVGELEWDTFQRHLDLQVKGTLNLCRAAHEPLRAARKEGADVSIITLLSQVIHGAPPSRQADYVTAKYALLGLSRALAAEWAGEGIRVNTVSPGLVQTELTQHYPERLFKMEASRTPLKRITEAEDVARVVAFLAGEGARHLTGVDIPVTGGQVMG
ncbi:MAG: SDR family oxidoreductase [Magnetococcales bacterium]|nr:SDR family oxidoreductase [Magnetococcales bacterium]